ncbi:MAG: SulP family inorganic anion transporter [Bacteroidetes bacterium]|nr:SulP family inorganic anion transporter [Bacteroidota bacterium]
MFANLKNDIPASIVVFLVAVPLCLGIALASGAPLFSGIIAGIVGGIVVGALSGSPLGVSGPAAGLAVIVLTAIQDLGAFEIFLMAVVLAGVIQMILGFLQAGIIAYYFPSSVIKGMLAGIGIVIFLKQIPHAFGYDKDYEGSLSFNQPDNHNTLSELYFMFEAITPGAVIISAISLAILILWERPFMKKIPVFKIVQGPLVVVALGIILNLVFSGTSMALSAEHIVAIPVAENLSGFFNQFTFPDFSQWNNPAVYMTAATIAIVASLETLLCLEATDKLDPEKRVSPANRELKAQGVGNLVSGLIGGLPVTQVIVRSSTNIQSGGRTKMSAIIHGFLLLFCVMAIPFVLNLIPLASLAAILFVVGYKLAKPVLFKQMYKLGWNYFIPFVITILGIVFTDLLIGIGLGMAVAIFFLLYDNYKKPFLFEGNEHMSDDGGIVRLELAEDVTFLNKANIQKALNQIPDNSKIIIDASRSINIDQDVEEIIEDFKIHASYSNIEVEVIDRKRKGLKAKPVKTLENAIAAANGKGNGKTKRPSNGKTPAQDSDGFSRN